jgi:hypothetical protein
MAPLGSPNIVIHPQRKGSSQDGTGSSLAFGGGDSSCGRVQEGRLDNTDI